MTPYSTLEYKHSAEVIVDFFATIPVIEGPV